MTYHLANSRLPNRANSHPFSRAEATVATCLNQAFPNRRFRLVPFQETTIPRQAWAFRCKEKGHNYTLVAKSRPETPDGRRRLLAEFDHLTRLATEMPNGPDRVPRPIRVFEEASVFFVEDAKGRTPRQILTVTRKAERVRETLSRAGSWLCAFHKTTGQSQQFDPSPHLNWLEALLEEHASGHHKIPSVDSFRAALRALQADAVNLIGHPYIEAVTHLDFNTGNLILRQNGDAYGIDFLNDARDIALRDLLFFTEDALVHLRRAGHVDMPYRQLWQAALDGYAEISLSDPVVTFFQTFFALNTWAGVGRHRTPTINDTIRLTLAQELVSLPDRDD